MRYFPLQIQAVFDFLVAKQKFRNKVNNIYGQIFMEYFLKIFFGSDSIFHLFFIIYGGRILLYKLKLTHF